MSINDNDSESLNSELLPQDIAYLSFEGGGGKGLAYAGPLVAFLSKKFSLESVQGMGIYTTKNLPYNGVNINQLVINPNRIKGIAGSSAGAITAALLASGVSLEAIGALLLNMNPVRFSKLNKYVGDNVIKSFKNVNLFDSLGGRSCDITQPDGFSKESTQLDGKVKEALGKFIGLIDEATTILPLGSPKLLLLPQLLAHLLGEPELKKMGTFGLINALHILTRDYGVFHGYTLRNYVDCLIKYYNGKKEDDPSITFAELYKINGLKLVITGTNMERGQVGYFSHETTPSMAIADAVRISASIPGAFKPVTINPDSLKSFYPEEKKLLDGLWVDGGASLNNPYHVFDLDGKGQLVKLTDPKINGKMNPKLLAMVLDESERIDSQVEFNPSEKMKGIFNYLFINLIWGVLSENSTQWPIRSSTERDRILFLPTDTDIPDPANPGKKKRLETMSFDAPTDVIAGVTKKCVKATLDKFKLSDSDNPLLNKDTVGYELNIHSQRLLDTLRAVR